MTSIKVMLNKFRKTNRGKYPLVFQIIHKRRKKLIYSPYHLDEQDFDREELRVTNISHSLLPGEADEVNRYIGRTLRELHRVVDWLRTNRPAFSAEDIVTRYKATGNKRYVSLYMKGLIDLLRATGHQGTAANYKSTLSVFHRFTDGREVLLDDLDTRTADDFTAFLKTQGMADNSVMFYIRIMRAVFNKALAARLVTDRPNPFKGIAVRQNGAEKEVLTKQEVRTIAELDLSDFPKLDLSRDLFLFSFYTRGMAFVDIAFLQYENISEGVITYVRNKTGQVTQVKITPRLNALIEKYRSSRSPFVLPVLRDAENLYHRYRYGLRLHNASLKEIGKLARTNVVLTSYVARYSWAAIAGQEGIPEPVIRAGLGETAAALKDTDDIPGQEDVDAANELITELH